MSYYLEIEKEYLENIINELSLFNSQNTDFWTWCNANEGVIDFLSVIASFLVSVVAVGFSVYTFRSQKILQTKSIQENAKLQRELTEQNNKLQADVKLREFRLKKIELLFDCYDVLVSIRSKMRRLTLQPPFEFAFRIENSILKEYLYCIIADANYELKVLRRSKFLFNPYYHPKIELIYENLRIIINTLEQVFSRPENMQLKVLKEKMNFLSEHKVNLVKQIEPLLKLLEKDLDISNLDKIINNS